MPPRISHRRMSEASENVPDGRHCQRERSSLRLIHHWGNCGNLNGTIGENRDEDQPICPDGPIGLLGLDLVGFQSLIISVVPLTNIFCENMIRCLGEVFGQEVEGIMSTTTRRYKDGAKVDCVDEF